MRVATWNINSIRTRVDRVIDFVDAFDIDVVLLQETKCRDDQFPLERFDHAGFEVFHWGVNQWNGVAVCSRLPLSQAETGFPGMPTFDKNGGAGDLEARAVSVSVSDTRLWSVYVPNGRGLTDPHMDYKLRFLGALGEAIRADRSASPDVDVVVGGDFNIAPLPHDVGDPDVVEGVSTHVSPAEREALEGFLATAGLVDLVRPLVPEGYSYWDYTKGKFQKNQGMRIDFVFGSSGVVPTVTKAEIVRSQRTGEQPSDHVPVLVEFGGDEEDADRPMVF